MEDVSVASMEESIRRYQGGALIQDAFPQLKAEEREFLITGLKPREWDQLMKCLENEDES
jgi:hypothetical protein